MFFKKQKTEAESKEKNKEPTYWERLIHGKGTVAEPWPTAEELWDDPKVQKALKNHRELIQKMSKS